MNAKEVAKRKKNRQVAFELKVVNALNKIYGEKAFKRQHKHAKDKNKLNIICPSNFKYYIDCKTPATDKFTMFYTCNDFIKWWESLMEAEIKIKDWNATNGYKLPALFIKQKKKEVVCLNSLSAKNNFKNKVIHRFKNKEGIPREIMAISMGAFLEFLAQEEGKDKIKTTKKQENLSNTSLKAIEANIESTPNYENDIIAGKNFAE